MDAIPQETVRNLRDRALIATLTYSFARIGAALSMKVEDFRPQGTGWELRLHEKGSKEHAMPCHHALAEALHMHIGAAGIGEDRKGVLFRTSKGWRGVTLSDAAMAQSDAWRMIRKRAVAAGIMASIGLPQLPHYQYYRLPAQRCLLRACPGCGGAREPSPRQRSRCYTRYAPVTLLHKVGHLSWLQQRCARFNPTVPWPARRSSHTMMAC